MARCEVVAWTSLTYGRRCKKRKGHLGVHPMPRKAQELLLNMYWDGKPAPTKGGET